MTSASEHGTKPQQSVMTRIFGAPKIRQEWGVQQDTEKVGWGELFFDLIFVSLAINLAVLMKKHHTAWDVVVYFSIWVVFYITWGDLSFYMTRFVSTALFTDAMLFGFTLSVCYMVFEVGFEDDHAFNIAAFFSKGFLSALYLHAYITLPRARYFAMVMGTGSMISGLFFLLAAFVSELNVIWWYGTAVAAYIYADIAFRKGPQYSIPINIEHYSERVGLLVMLILGESIISITTTADENTTEGAMVLGFGYLLVFATKGMYFGAQPHQHSLHALRQNVKSGRSFVWLHMFLTFFVLGLGAGLKVMAYYSADAHVHTEDYWFFAFNVFGLLVFMNLVRLTHGFKSRPKGPWTARIVVTILTIILPLFGNGPTTPEVVIIYSLMLAALNGIDALAADKPAEHHHTTEHESTTARPAFVLPSGNLVVPWHRAPPKNDDVDLGVHGNEFENAVFAEI